MSFPSKGILQVQNPSLLNPLDDYLVQRVLSDANLACPGGVSPSHEAIEIYRMVGQEQIKHYNIMKQRIPKPVKIYMYELP